MTVAERFRPSAYPSDQDSTELVSIVDGTAWSDIRAGGRAITPIDVNSVPIEDDRSEKASSTTITPNGWPDPKIRIEYGALILGVSNDHSLAFFLNYLSAHNCARPSNAKRLTIEQLPVPPQR
jgi:hypothetical protein